jgi:hypothetical protein
VFQFKFAPLIAGAILIATPAFAQNSTEPAATSAPVKEKKICRRDGPATGSILGGHVTCHTKTEWAGIDAANSRGADEMLRRSRENIGGASR